MTIQQRPWENVIFLVTKCIPGVGVEKREENIESFSAVTSLGRMELCKSSTCTRRSARLRRQGQLCHDPWLVTKTACQKGNERAYSTTNGLDGLEFSIDPVRSSELLDWHHVFRPRNWCQIAVLPSLLLEAPSCESVWGYGTIPEWWGFIYLWILVVIFTLIWDYLSRWAKSTGSTCLQLQNHQPLMPLSMF